MKIIQPAEISAKIMTLIDDAEKELIIISPYNNIKGWIKFINRIKNAQSRNVPILWYSRKNNVTDDNAEEVRTLGIEPILIDNLHAKIYMNEKRAIFTSMNMSKASDDQSIDLGYITENSEEYDDIYNVFEKYIRNIKSKNKYIETPAKFHYRIGSKKENLPQKISSKHYINCIHEHIFKKYGIYNYEIKNGGNLEYFDFIKSGYKIQFESYEQAIKIYIHPPYSMSVDEIENVLLRNQNVKKLCFSQELSFSEYEYYIKYFYTSNIKLIYWEKNSVELFLKDLDTVVGIVFPES